ncbi:MAG TPA: coenzyme F420-0:L-glutamate ligase [Acidobacteriota bacterium]|nr:coenzyme F420-0:L-glutamate ligase [Acidobacteriota bacterium]
MIDLEILALPLKPEIQAGDDLTELLYLALRGRRLTLRDGDLLVVCHKVVSKAEGRIVELDSITPSPTAKAWAARFGKDPRLVELVLSQARRIVRMQDGIIIAETVHGFVAAHCGVDRSNAPPGSAILLPVSPDASARRLAKGLGRRFRCQAACLISDTFGRPWRLGLVDVALGLYGFDPLLDLRGEKDLHGRELSTTILAVADQAAAAAGLLMGKGEGVPAVLVRGLDLPPPGPKSNGKRLLRSARHDLFR